jgi:hypothetical protein
LETNRELYLAIRELCDRQTDNDRSLELYLSALVRLAQQYSSQATLSLTQFYSLIRDAFDAKPLPFDETWRNPDDFIPDNSSFERWRSIAIAQVVDLHEMSETGILAHEQRYFGVTSPRGSLWHNFDPVGYLECAMAGSFGGWEPEDPGDRIFVPGAVATIDEQGNLQSVDPQDLDRPVVSIPALCWSDFIDFVWCGQMYE